MIDSTLTTPDTQTYKFETAIIIGKGSPAYPWAKCLLPNGDQAFIYPDDEETVFPKALPAGTEVFITSARPCRKPGNTKWTVNPLHIMLQPEAVKQIMKDLPQPPQIVTEELPLQQEEPKAKIDNFSDLSIDLPDLSTAKGEKAKISMEHTFPRQLFVDRVVDHFGLQGPKRRAEALGIIVDLFMANSKL